MTLAPDEFIRRFLMYVVASDEKGVTFKFSRNSPSSNLNPLCRKMMGGWWRGRSVEL
jgi:hypothetical protein